MPAPPLVSVVLPTKNRADLLSRSAGSVLAQSFRDLELIIVDDGSDEDLRPAIEALDDERVIYIRRDVNGGPAAARNTGIQSARGKYVAFQDSDDQWLGDKLDSQVAAMESAPAGSVLCVCGLLRAGSAGIRVYPPGSPGRWPRIDYAAVIARPDGYVQTWLARRESLVQAGLFNERLRLREDWEFMIRMAALGPVIWVPRHLVVSRRAPDSLTVSAQARWSEAFREILAVHESALGRWPRQLAALRYTFARALCQSGHLAEARQQLMASLRLRPFRARTWLLLAASLLGAGVVQPMLGLRSGANSDGGQ